MSTNHDNMHISHHHKSEHDYHLVDPSPLPLISAMSLLVMASGAILYMHKFKFGHVVLPLGFLMVLSCMYSWWRKVIKEGVVENAHTEVVRNGLRIGMGLFILTEVMFFFAFFFSYFKSALFPVDILEDVWAVKPGVWPPAGIEKLEAWNLPFMNTLILLLSGTTVTWAHHALLNNNRKEVVQGLTCTVLLGIAFTLFQAIEYHHASFKITDGVYPSNFYMATGFHGAHVIIGTIFLTVCLFRARQGGFDNGKGHLGFEFAAWYWHFVDVVWLFLFVFVYAA